VNTDDSRTPAAAEHERRMKMPGVASGDGWRSSAASDPAAHQPRVRHDNPSCRRHGHKTEYHGAGSEECVRPLPWTSHAPGAPVDRGIDRADVERTVADPELAVADPP
jgi:hypothetical protein